jgi:two-component system, NtrC family, response regulator HydG
VTARVLVVDDDRDHAESVADLLGMRGHAVTVAYSGETGLAMFQGSEFDVTLMDVQLPGMNGVQTFFELRKIKPDAKIIMMTGFSVEHLLAQAVEDGAVGILHKPFAANDVVAMLDRVKPRGLVVAADDAPDTAARLESVLARNGYSVQIGRTEREALGTVLAGGIDCLILELRMPMLSSLEVYLRLKETGRITRTILVTDYAVTESQTPTHPVGEWLLIKPFDPGLLLRAIDSVVHDKQS